MFWIFAIVVRPAARGGCRPDVASSPRRVDFKID
jgi:hypothetical protein